MPPRFGIAAMGAGSGRTWLINEDCEGTGTPSGWTTVSGSPNWDYTAVPLEAAQSLYLTTATAANRVRVDFTDQTEIWIYMLLRFTNGAGPGVTVVFGGVSANGNASINQNFSVGASSRLVFGGPTPTATVSVDTTYHVWLHDKQGTGADGVVDIGFSTTGVRPTSGSGFAQITNGGGTNLMGRLWLGPSVTNLGWDIIIDKIRVATTQINDNGA